MRRKSPLSAGLAIAAALAGTGLLPVPAPAADDSDLPHVGLRMGKEGIEVLFDGESFTTYRFDVEGTPVFYPVIGPNGENITRHYPMKEGVDGEMMDHVHHRSIWFGHREVNGHNFWGSRPKDAHSVHRSVRRMESGGAGKPAIIVVENEMTTSEGKVLFTDEREYRITALSDGEALLEYGVTIKADQGEDVVFGDEKDGLLGIRVAPWLRFEDRKGVRGTGQILNSEGVKGKQAWGKRADWVDYFGEAPDGKTYGVAMFDHPGNLRHPTWWHARHYGLLSVNPFGQGAFEPDAPEDAGEYTIVAGDELTLRYAFYFHRGKPSAARVAERYETFAAED